MATRQLLDEEVVRIVVRALANAFAQLTDKQGGRNVYRVIGFTMRKGFVVLVGGAERSIALDTLSGVHEVVTWKGEEPVLGRDFSWCLPGRQHIRVR